MTSTIFCLGLQSLSPFWAVSKSRKQGQAKKEEVDVRQGVKTVTFDICPPAVTRMFSRTSPVGYLPAVTEALARTSSSRLSWNSPVCLGGVTVCLLFYKPPFLFLVLSGCTIEHEVWKGCERSSPLVELLLDHSWHIPSVLSLNDSRDGQHVVMRMLQCQTPHSTCQRHRDLPLRICSQYPFNKGIWGFPVC